MQHDKHPAFDDAAREKTGRDRGHGPRRGRPWLKASLRPADSLEDPRTPTAAVMGPGDSPVGRVGQLLPSLASLVANPSSASEVPVERIPALVAELASQQSLLSALRGALTTRLLRLAGRRGEATGTERQADDRRSGGDCAWRDATLGAEKGTAAAVRAPNFRARDQA
jgi:hypothetical protein